MVEIIKEKIDIARVVASVEDPAAGGVAVFIGTTRNHSDGKNVLALEYDAYVPMALKLMNRIAAEAKSRWGLQKISVVHRIGHLAIGDASVVIAVSSAHRNEAFEACRYAIDTLKQEVPIWKKEYFQDGALWVESEQGTQRP